MFVRARIGTTLALALSLVIAPSLFAQARGNPDMKKHLMDVFDMSNPIINLDELLAPGVNKDGIPALTDPKKTPAASADFPSLTDRVISVVINDEAVAYPIKILNWHEAANDTVGGVPIVVMYCPLCDSAAVADRRVTTKDGKELTLEFGISGFLYDSNMVLYDQTSMGIWSQVYMRAMTGPLAGTRLKLLPMRVEPFAKFIAAHPNGEVLTKDTGYQRPYDRNPYEAYLKDSERVFQKFVWRHDLPPKVLGAGIADGDDAVFVTTAAVKAHGGTMKVKTKHGEVTVLRNDAGFAFEDVPAGVDVMQAFWHAWSAFHPKTRLIAAEGEAKSGDGDDDGD